MAQEERVIGERQEILVYVAREAKSTKQVNATMTPIMRSIIWSPVFAAVPNFRFANLVKLIDDKRDVHDAQGSCTNVGCRVLSNDAEAWESARFCGLLNLCRAIENFPPGPLCEWVMH